MSGKQQYHTGGPFRAEQLRSGDPYELDDGHPVECLPSGGRHAKASLSGGLALETDPGVASAGFDTGFAPDEKNLLFAYNSEAVWLKWILAKMVQNEGMFRAFEANSRPI